MIEIRSIHLGETHEFLRLLCDVFDLNFERATGVFHNEPMFDIDRKWALFEDGQMSSILTTVPLQFGWGTGIGIAGVATRADRRGKGLAERLLQHVLEVSTNSGESCALLFAKEIGLYKRLGFEVVDEVVRANIEASASFNLEDIVEFDGVRALYSNWSQANPNRLRRDDRRWKLWHYHFRVCSRNGNGYVCHEGTVIRECLQLAEPVNWNVASNSEWLGLRSMARMLSLPLQNEVRDTYFMARNAPDLPQMFLTDQF